MGDLETFQERLECQAQRLRSQGGLGRSDSLLRLFDFLVTQTLAGRSPKEIEIAQDVFGKQNGFDVVLDASVRVYIHRLRTKIDAFYTADDSKSERLFIPKGEYRLALAAAGPDPHVDDDTAAAPSPHAQKPSLRIIAIAAVGLMLCANIAAWVIVAHNAHTSPLAETVGSTFWSPLANDGQPTVLVTGDYYIFGEAPKAMDVGRLIREFSINSKYDLDQYLMAHPGDIGRYVDMDLHYLPTSIPLVLRNVLPIVAQTTGGPEGRELLIPMSQMTPDMLKKANIIYVGYLSGLGLLRDPVFDASGFQIGSSYDELIDRITGKHYVSDQGDVTDGRSPRRDFAYIASLPGPSGTRVLIVSGTRDAAVLQAGEIVSDAKQLARLAASAGNAPAFEALYEVRTLGDLNLGSTLILARGLHAEKLWKLEQAHQHSFPDQSPPVK